MGHRTPSGRDPKDAIATFTVRGADTMTPAGRRAIAAWLRKVGAHLVKKGDQYEARFTARYFEAR